MKRRGWIEALDAADNLGPRRMTAPAAPPAPRTTTPRPGNLRTPRKNITCPRGRYPRGIAAQQSLALQVTCPNRHVPRRKNTSRMSTVSTTWFEWDSCFRTRVEVFERIVMTPFGVEDPTARGVLSPRGKTHPMFDPGVVCRVSKMVSH